MLEDILFSSISAGYETQLMFSLSAGFRGKIISRVFEVFCLSWATPVSRDGSERDSMEALAILKFTCR